MYPLERLVSDDRKRRSKYFISAHDLGKAFFQRDDGERTHKTKHRLKVVGPIRWVHLVNEPRTPLGRREWERPISLHRFDVGYIFGASRIPTPLEGAAQGGYGGIFVEKSQRILHPERLGNTRHDSHRVKRVSTEID
jgi:hypothetical protein